MTKSRLRRLRRRGAASLEYVMLGAVVVPISIGLLVYLVKSIKAFYYLSSILLSWIIY